MPQPAIWLELGGLALVCQALAGERPPRTLVLAPLALALVGVIEWAAWQAGTLIGALLSLVLAAGLHARARELPQGPLRSFVGAFDLALVLAGLLGIYLGSLSLDVHLFDTYFIHAFDHLRTMTTLLLAVPIGVLWCWPTIAPRATLRPAWWCCAAWVSGSSLFAYVGLAAALGHQGMPRRYVAYLPEYELMQRMMSLAALGVVLGLALWIIDLVRASTSSPALTPSEDRAPTR